jgi:NADP-dependent aldehyde dehydrogenase
MSSINPVFVLPSAVKQRAEAIAQGLADSATLGTGQFCTKPGIVIGIEGAEFERFQQAAKTAFEAKVATTMLNSGIHRAYEHGTAQWDGEAKVNRLAIGQPPASTTCAGQPMLFATKAQDFLTTPMLMEEVFGPSTLLIACKDVDEMIAVAEHLSGQLTATLHLADEDVEIGRRLLPVLERKAGRILANGFPTGVEVSYAMVHGGPSPATSDSRVTSVGAMAIERWLRPVCYQDMPSALLAEALQDGNPLQILRLVDGKLQQP